MIRERLIEAVCIATIFVGVMLIVHGFSGF